MSTATTGSVTPSLLMSFSGALVQLKAGKTVARKWWRDGVLIFLVPGSQFTVSRAPLNTVLPEGAEIKYQPHIDIKVTADTVCVWTCTQADLMAEDWYVVE